MAARHKKMHKAAGGIAVDSGQPQVIKEAEEKKRGGRANDHDADDRKRGGKAMGKMHGALSRHRLDKPGRKTGGRVGADKSPLSSANRSASAPAEPRSQTGSASD